MFFAGQSATRTQAGAVFGFFVVNGSLYGVWGGSIPLIKERLHTEVRGISLLLIAMGLACMVSMQISGRWADRRGALRPTVTFALLMAAGAVGIALAPNYRTTLAAVVLFGAGGGSMDVCMNMLGVGVEREAGVSLMSRFHAGFSLGALVGAGLVLGSPA